MKLRRAPGIRRLESGGFCLYHSSARRNWETAAGAEGGTALLEAGADVASADGSGNREAIIIDILGYRQTKLSAAEGGKLVNGYGWRLRHGAMRAFARTFAGQPFLTGHDWGDVRSRGGLVIKAWAGPPANGEEGELAAYQRAELTAEWAREAYQQGQIDRFSIAASGTGDVRCTVHDCPPWSGDCWCWPGSDCGDGRIAEFEWEGAIAHEVSAVNVAAVDGTGFEEVAAGLSDMVGRKVPDRLLELLAASRDSGLGRWEVVAAIAARAGVGAPAPSSAEAPSLKLAKTEPTPPPENSMDREKMARKLGLAPEATWEQIEAEMDRRSAVQASLQQSQASLQAENDASHFDREVASLRQTHELSDVAVTRLRSSCFAAAAAGGAATLNRAQLASSLELLRETAPKKAPAPVAVTEHSAQFAGARPATLSSLPMGPDPGSAAALAAGEDRLGMWTQNPDTARELKSMMAAARITVADIQAHGPTKVATVPEDVINQQRGA